MTNKLLTVQVVGYQPRESILPDDYADFRIGTRFGWEETKNMAQMGVFPPGIILQTPGGYPCVIEGAYETEQVAVPLEVR